MRNSYSILLIGQLNLGTASLLSFLGRSRPIRAQSLRIFSSTCCTVSASFGVTSAESLSWLAAPSLRPGSVVTVSMFDMLVCVRAGLVSFSAAGSLVSFLFRCSSMPSVDSLAQPELATSASSIVYCFLASLITLKKFLNPSEW